MKATDYKIISGTAFFVENQVRNWISRGWQPIGGVAHHDPYSNDHAMQAMVLPEPEKFHQPR